MPSIGARSITRARCHVLGLGVPSLDSADLALQDAAVATRRRTSEAIFIDPEETGEVPLMLIEGLLTGDLRSAPTTGPP